MGMGLGQPVTNKYEYDSLICIKLVYLEIVGILIYGCLSSG